MSHPPTTNTIADAAGLDEQFGQPNDLVLACVKTSMDRYHKLFIAHSPLVCLASCSANGQPTISPKGDAPGFVRALDDRTLVIPDRIGNKKVLSFRNLVENPAVALIFFVPGCRETLRVEGKARIVRDPETLELGRVGQSLPAVATVVEVTRVYFHCGKALVRSKLWAPESRVAGGVLPSLGELLTVQTPFSGSIEEADAFAEDEYANRLY